MIWGQHHQLKMLVRKFTEVEELRDRNGVCVRRYRWTQGRKICALDAPARKSKPRLQHTLNLLRGVMVSKTERKSQGAARLELVAREER
jgi:hypothetical protein